MEVREAQMSDANSSTGSCDNSQDQIRIQDRIRELRRVKARDLLPNPKNWRRHPKAQADALRGLLNEIGYADALLARELPDGRLMLIDGHLRAETTPDAQVPVLVLDVSADEADKILLTLDPLAAMAESDAERIKLLLQTVRTDNQALEELLRRTAGAQLWSVLHPQAEPPAQIDQAGELQRKWGTRTNQLWRIGKHRLLCGDATKAEDVAVLMGGERAVLFATDPPYAVGYTGGSHPQSWANRGAANRDKDWSGQYLEAKNADVKNAEEAGVELYRGFIGMALKHALVRNAAWYCWHASRRQMMLESIWNEFGAFVHQQIIWVKSRPVLTYSTYLWQHEPCLFGWIRGEKPKTLRSQVGAVANEFPTTAWEVSSSEVETDAHPTSKPCRLFSLPMEMHTERGDLCYEPFSGSGSQLVAAQQTGRRCYAIEKSAPFVAVALERMAALGLEPELIGE
jgi:DNA modification methylase